MNNSLYNQNCPPIMNDGRYICDYRPSSYVHDLILKQNNIKNSYDMKKLLTDNAVKFQNMNTTFLKNKNSCNSCDRYYLIDPNNNDKYWELYNKWIGYSNI